MNIDSNNNLDIKPNLSDEQISKVALISPAIRMLHSNRTKIASVTAFSVDNIKKQIRGLKAPVKNILITNNNENLFEIFESFTKARGSEPRIIINDLCAFALGKDMADAQYTKSFFINNINSIINGNMFLPDWGSATLLSEDKRLFQKIIIVTGAAQGFGYGIAQHLASNGAYVVLADINLLKAEKAAEKFRESFGPYAAIAIQADVTDEASVKRCINETVAFYGGLDVLISNAGVLKAGAVEDLSLKDFMHVTNVNYTGYFIFTKYAFPIMKLQNSINPGYWMDIIQINSKSGLIGSNKNCAYAGSKFGGIGLTQSFALELIVYNIKVNSICPGNYLNGPLWSDPETGLFTQYIKTNKIRGAETIEDLKAFYNKKVPMGRSCEVADVTKAIMYVMEQNYETGQAFPVTGGQLMLS